MSAATSSDGGPELQPLLRRFAGRRRFGANYDLARMEALVARRGDPQLDLPGVHRAGTPGPGPPAGGGRGLAALRRRSEEPTEGPAEDS